MDNVQNNTVTTRTVKSSDPCRPDEPRPGLVRMLQPPPLGWPFDLEVSPITVHLGENCYVIHGGVGVDQPAVGPGGALPCRLGPGHYSWTGFHWLSIVKP
ncbi:hypothetical protein ACOMHN_025240 [Nucella lapillus]